MEQVGPLPAEEIRGGIGGGVIFGAALGGGPGVLLGAGLGGTGGTTEGFLERPVDAVLLAGSYVAARVRGPLKPISAEATAPR